MTKPRKPRPGPLDPPSRVPDTDPEALRAALTLLLADPGPDISSLFPCLTDREESNRLGKDR